MNYEETLEYLNRHGWNHTEFGLERTFELLKALGDPHKALKFVHVAGSNGKGSTCAMLAEILKTAGYRTGLYISPYIQDFCERMQVNNIPISHDRLLQIAARVIEASEKMEVHPTHFEMVTAIGMEFFYEEKCDIVVLEVGMGGEFDSTNVIDAPEAAVITNIGLDHTEYLGNTIAEIAHTKGGIIKPGTTCVCYNKDPEAVRVISEICAERDVPLTLSHPEEITPVSSSLMGQCFRYKRSEYLLRLLGKHQQSNAAVVLETVDVLRSKGYKISSRAVRKAFETVSWPARFEILSTNPLFFLDGGHNPQCAQALTECLDEYLPGEKVTFLIGMLADKDYGSVLDIVAPYAKRFICIRPDSPRALDPEVLAQLAYEKGCEAEACPTPEEGVDICKAVTDSPVVAFGSLYTAGKVRTLMGL